MKRMKAGKVRNARRSEGKKNKADMAEKRRKAVQMTLHQKSPASVDSKIGTIFVMRILYIGVLSCHGTSVCLTV